MTPLKALIRLLAFFAKEINARRIAAEAGRAPA